MTTSSSARALHGGSGPGRTVAIPGPVGLPDVRGLVESVDRPPFCSKGRPCVAG